MMPIRRLALFAVVSAVLSAGYGVVFTLVDNYRDHYHIPSGQLGLMIGTGFISGFLANILLAPLADRGHARALIVGGAAMFIAGLIGMALSTTITPLMVARFVMGVGAGMATPAIRRLVIVADPEHLGKNLGRMLAADVGGFAAGPILAAAFDQWHGLQAPFYVLAALTAVLTIVVARSGTNVVGDARGEVGDTIAPTPRFAFDLFRQRSFVAACVLGVVSFVMIGAFDTLWSMSLADLHASVWLANLGITLFALPLVVLGSTGGRLAQRIGPFRWGTLGLAMAAIFMFLYGQLPSAAVMFAVAMVHSVTDGFTVISSGVAVGLVVPAARQAAAHGAMGAAQNIVGGVVAPAIGVVYEDHGRGWAFGAAAVTMVALLVVSVVLARPTWRIAGSVDEIEFARADLNRVELD